MIRKKITLTRSFPAEQTTQNEPNPDHVDVESAHELHYWTEKFGCTKEQLKEAVKQVGQKAQAVRAQLGRKTPIALPGSVANHSARWAGGPP